MLYLEDYLEMIEHLPQELRDRFTEMRELDLTVQNCMDSLEKKTRSFFVQCKRGDLQDEAADGEFQNLRKEYYKVLEDADEKVTIATQIHELVERYLRRLDSELFKFKCELEADNNGITEILEKRSLEMDGGSSAATALLTVAGLNQKENRYYGGLSAAVAPSSSNSHSAVIGGAAVGIGGITVPATPTGATKDNRYRTPKPEKRRDSTSTLQSAVPEKRANMGNSLTAGTPPVAVVRPITPGMGAVLNPAATTVGTPSAVAYNLQQISGSASTAIAAAASQAIVATQQMQQGRRTASLKASYEAIHGAGGGPTEFWISRDIANAAAAASAVGLTAASTSTTTSTTEKTKKKKLNASLTHGVTATNVTASTPTGLHLGSSSSSLSVDSVDLLAASTSNLNVPSLVTAQQHVTASSSSIGTSSTATSIRGALNSSSSVTSASSSSTSTALTPGSNITLNENGMVVEQTPEGEWSYDPNEPRYCTCNQVSYGDMVACDNDACPYEWFHYPCVGITQPPKGKWYCPKCTASMRRRGNRKN